MYNDYYLQSIDNKLGQVLVNQESIDSNFENIIQNQIELGSLISHAFIWLYLILFILVFYNMFHTMFNHHK